MWSYAHTRQEIPSMTDEKHIVRLWDGAKGGFRELPISVASGPRVRKCGGRKSLRKELSKERVFLFLSTVPSGVEPNATVYSIPVVPTGPGSQHVHHIMCRLAIICVLGVALVMYSATGFFVQVALGTSKGHKGQFPATHARIALHELLHCFICPKKCICYNHLWIPYMASKFRAGKEKKLQSYIYCVGGHPNQFPRRFLRPPVSINLGGQVPFHIQSIRPAFYFLVYLNFLFC